MREMPKPYERYKHFKGREYQVLLIAKNEKTMEDMVVYQALYEPYQIYVREAGEFLSAVDKEKYPNALQDERFKLIEDERKNDARQAAPVRSGEAVRHEPAGSADAIRTAEPVRSTETVRTEPVKTEPVRSAESVRTAADEKPAEEKPAEPVQDNNGVDPVLMRFLDAEDGPAQLKVLEECAGKITEQILTPMELSMGMEPSTESIDERIRNIRNNITTKMKYEIRR